MSFLKAQVIFPSNFASASSAIKHNSSIIFLAQTLCTLVKSSPLKCKFFRFLSVRVKIRQIPHINFELKSQFLFKFYIILIIFMIQNFPVNFKPIHFLLQTNGCHQGPNQGTFKCSGENLSKSSCQILHEAQASFSSNFVSILSVIIHNSSVLFQLKHYILWSKSAH